MRLCHCAAPLRCTTVLDRTRCLRCAGWTAHGRILHPDRTAVLAGEARSLLAKLADDYPYVHDLAHDPTRRPQNGRAAGVSDPTGRAVADTTRQTIRALTVISDRLLERAVRDLRNIDEAIGDALLAAEPPGPVDHTPAPFHDTIPANRPDLEDAHAARHRRQGRGEL